MYQIENQSFKEIAERLGGLVELLKAKGFGDSKGKMNNGIFAKSVGIDPGQFSRVKTGEFNITLKQILEISSTYGVRLVWLLTGEEPVFMDEIKKPDEKPGAVQADVRNEINIIKASLEKIEKALSGKPSEGIAPASREQDLGLGNMEGEGLEAANGKIAGSAP